MTSRRQLSLAELQQQLQSELKTSDILEQAENSTDVSGGNNIDEMIENLTGGGRGAPVASNDDAAVVEPADILDQVLNNAAPGILANNAFEEESIYSEIETESSSVLTDDDADEEDEEEGLVEPDSTSEGSAFTGGVTKFVPRVRVINAFPFLLRT
jgi:hypothetical protein